jgi:hypothetical protein
VKQFCARRHEWLAVAQGGVQDVDAASGGGEDGLVVSFAFGWFAVVEGAPGSGMKEPRGF